MNPFGADESAFRDAVAAYAAEYGLALDAATVDRFAVHYGLLVRWNRKLNLTRITEPREAARRHFLESAFLTTLVPAPTAVVDVGSGAGFPGLPLACLWGSSSVTLVEPLVKRCVFLKESVRAMGLTNVRVVEAKFSDDVVPPGALLVSRALDGFEGLLPELMKSSAATVALYSEPRLLERARGFRDGRIVALPASERRMIGVFG